MLKEGFDNFKTFLGIYMGLSTLEIGICNYVVEKDFKSTST